MSKGGIVGNSKNSRRTTNGYKIFCYIPDFYLSVKTPPGFEEKTRKIPEISRDMVEIRLMSSPCFLLARNQVGNAIVVFPFSKVY
jgi:hypothetical protein